MNERKRERKTIEREHRKRLRDKNTERKTEKQRNRKTEKHTNRETEKQTNIQTDKQPKKTYKQRDKVIKISYLSIVKGTKRRERGTKRRRDR